MTDSLLYSKVYSSNSRYLTENLNLGGALTKSGGCFLKGGIITAPRKSGKDFRGAVYLSDSFSVYESVSEWFILQ